MIARLDRELLDTGNDEPDPMEHGTVGMSAVPDLDPGALRARDPIVVDDLEQIANAEDHAVEVADDDGAAPGHREALMNRARRSFPLGRHGAILTRLTQ